MNEMHPLLARLVEVSGRPILDEELLELFTMSRGDSVIFVGGDPAQHPECLDVAVVLPELSAQFTRLRNIGVASREIEPLMQMRYGIQRWPSLVFLRDGGYIGTISGMQDWQVFQERITDLLQRGPSRPPSIGVAVAAPASHSCH